MFRASICRILPAETYGFGGRKLWFGNEEIYLKIIAELFGDSEEISYLCKWKVEAIADASEREFLLTITILTT